MQETEELSDGDEEIGGEESTKRPRVISGDDLGDSFSVEEDKLKRGWIDDVLEREDDVDNSESDENDSSSEDSESEEEEDDESDGGDEKQRKRHHLEDWEQSDDELGDELEDEEEDDDEEDDEPRVHKKLKNDYAAPNKGEGLSGTVKQKTNMKKLSSTQRDIPFMIDPPKNFEELLALVEDCSNEDVILIVNRIRIAHSIKIKAENRKKMQVRLNFALKDLILVKFSGHFMPHLLSDCLLLFATQVFYGVLLQYFAVLTSKKPLNFDLLNMLVKPLIEMSMEIPYFAAICARQRLLKTRAQFCEAIKNPGL